MGASTPPRGRVVIVGAGPAGIATALSVAQAGHDAVLLERYPEAKPAGNIINLWPPPIKALGLLGVDTVDLGAGSYTEFRNLSGRPRVAVHLPEDVVRQYEGGFIGMLRPQLYARMLAALPDGVLQLDRQVERFDQDEGGVRVHLTDGTVLDADVLVGADGIDSLVRRQLHGEVPVREHDLHVIGGFTFEHPEGSDMRLSVITHDRTRQGSWGAIRDGGREGFQWWTVLKHDHRTPFTEEPHAVATAATAHFPAPLPQLVAATRPEDVFRWPIRDRKPLPQWADGRVTLVGDAAHATSPYAAYGAGMAIEDGYFLGRRLAGVDLADPAAVTRALLDFEGPRRPHSAAQVQQAFVLGKVFHHTPAPLRPLRDLVLDRTPLLQKQVGEASPREILAQLEEIDRVEGAFAPAGR